MATRDALVSEIRDRLTRTNWPRLTILIILALAGSAAFLTSVACYRRLRQEDAGHWTGAVLRRTWVPAAILVIFMSVAGFAAQAPVAAERLIGLLNLPDMISQPCGPDTPVRLDVYDMPSAAKPPIGAITYEVSDRKPKGVECSDTRTVLRRASGGEVEQVPMDESDYELSAAIVYQQSGPWFRIALQSGSAWIRRDDSKDFLRYPEMLQERLTHLAAGWDGRLWRTPGASSARAVSPEVTKLLKAVADANSDVDVDVLAVRRVRGQAWIQVRVLNAHCDGEDPVTLDTGWVPAYRATREPSVWFYSRGC